MKKFIIDPVYYLDYIFSGNARFSLVNLKTQNEVYFSVRKSRHDEFWWVNDRLKFWLGKIEPVDGPSGLTGVFWFNKRKEFLNDFQKKDQQIFDWFFASIEYGQTSKGIVKPIGERLLQLSESIRVKYEGRCGHCGRELSHPESIPIGIGPDCFVKLGLTHKSLILKHSIVL